MMRTDSKGRWVRGAAVAACVGAAAMVPAGVASAKGKPAGAAADTSATAGRAGASAGAGSGSGKAAHGGGASHAVHRAEPQPDVPEPEKVTAALERAMPDVQGCISSGGVDQTGTVTVTSQVRFDDTGKVITCNVQVGLAGTKGGDANKVRACVAGVLRGIRFPSSDSPVNDIMRSWTLRMDREAGTAPTRAARADSAAATQPATAATTTTTTTTKTSATSTSGGATTGARATDAKTPARTSAAAH